jgi:ribonuclease PH
MLSSVSVVIQERLSSLSTLRSLNLCVLTATVLCLVVGPRPLSLSKVQGSTVTVDKALTPTAKEDNSVRASSAGRKQYYCSISSSVPTSSV